MADEGSIITFNPQPHNEVEFRQALQKIYTLVPPSTHSATRDPFSGTDTGTDDITKGWRIGSRWINTTTNVLFICTDNTEDNATWQQMVGTTVATAIGGVAAPDDLVGAEDYVGIGDASTGTIVRTVLDDLVAAVLGNHHHVSAGTGGVLPFFRNVVTKTANYTATADDGTILCDATGGAFTVTLPDVLGYSGYGFRIKKTDSSANAVTVQGAI